MVGVGSGGTLTGLGRFFAKVSPKTEMVLADPVGSVLAPLIKTGKMEEAGSWTVEGIGEDFVPPNADLSLVKKAYSISDKHSDAGGPRPAFAGKAFWPARPPARCLPRRCAIAASRPTAKRVVTFVCDSGNKYLSKVFDDFWLAEQGLSEQAQHGDLRDLVARSHARGRHAVGRTRRQPAHRLRPHAARRRLAAAGASTTASSSASSTRATSSRSSKDRMMAAGSASTRRSAPP